MTDSPLAQYDDAALERVVTIARDDPYKGYDLALLLTEARDGILISCGYTDYRNIDDHPVQQALDALDLPHELEIRNRRLYHDQTGKEAPKTPEGFSLVLDGAEVERDHIGTLDYYVARNPDRLLRLPPQKNIHHGQFLGYPEPDIEAFQSDDYPIFEPLPIAEHIASGDLSPEDAVYAALTRYGPAHTLAGLERAIERGKAYYEACQHFDDYCNTTVATDYADDIMDTLRENHNLDD